MSDDGSYITSEVNRTSNTLDREDDPALPSVNERLGPVMIFCLSYSCSNNPFLQANNII